MTVAIIFILALAWVAFLAPTILRARNNQVRADSVGDFHHRLRALGRTNGTQRKGPRPRPSHQPIFGPVTSGSPTMSPAQRRRRDVLLVLMIVAVTTLLVALVTRSMPAIALHLLVDAALGGYVYLLLQYKQQRSRRSVRALRHTPRVAGPYAPYPTVDAHRARPP